MERVEAFQAVYQLIEATKRIERAQQDFDKALERVQSIMDQQFPLVPKSQ